MAKEIKKIYNYCHYCNNTIIGSSYKFKAHLFTHDINALINVKPRFKCEYCSKEYFRRDVFLKHLESHTLNSRKSRKSKVRVYFCNHCGRGYKSKVNLIYHLKCHDDLANPHKYRHRCKVCDLSFSEKRILQHHIRKTHLTKNGNEPLYLSKKLNESWVEAVLNTDYCVEITKLNNNTILLKKCVSGNGVLPHVKNYKCDIKSDLNYGSKTYSEVKCHYCEKIMFKKSIRKHIQEVHLNIRKFKCKNCKRSFNRRYQMSTHICTMANV